MDDWLLHADRLRTLRPNSIFVERQYSCSACLDFDLHRISCSNETRPLYDGNPARYRTSIDLPLGPILKAAEAGCQGCAIFRFVMKPHLKDVRLPAVIFIRDDKPYIYMLCIREERNDLNYGFHYFNAIWPENVNTSYHGPWALPRTSAISGNTGSEQAINKARSWLDRCNKSHMSCSMMNDAKLPTRVLEIEQIDKVRLYVTSNETAPYACLSHCWGPKTSHIPRLLGANLKEYQNSIPLALLTKSFREAVEFTYRLGLRYIWIDSLCIIQDSIDDWRAEGGRMADIYESAYITLAAAHASSSDEGCFSVAKEVHLSRYMTASSQNPYEEPYQVHARSFLAHGEQEAALLPLFSRGWIFQERQLSRRMIYFTREELIWECETGNWCECQPESHNFVFGASKRPYLAGPDAPPDELTCLENWHSIVNDYTKLSLTFAKDIFPALQGLAKRYRSLCGNYVAGLWEPTLLYSLTWFMCKDDDIQERPLEWRAPTWSWASVGGSIAFLALQGHRPRTFASIVKVITVPKGGETTGELDSAEIVLQGRCVKGTFRFVFGEVEPHIEIEPQGHLPAISIEQAFAYTHQSNNESGGHQDEYKIIEGYSGGGMFLDYRVDCSGSHHVPDGSEVLLMKVDETSPGHDDADDQSVQGWLVLYRPLPQEGNYRRIAVLKLTRNGTYSKHMENLYEIQATEMIVTIE